MVAEALDDPYGRYFLENGIILYALSYDDVGRGYIDGIDNDGDGAIDDGIDKGIDEPGEIWFDGVDNDNDCEIGMSCEANFIGHPNESLCVPDSYAELNQSTLQAFYFFSNVTYYATQL